jgi:hypothetical protein
VTASPPAANHRRQRVDPHPRFVDRAHSQSGRDPTRSDPDHSSSDRDPSSPGRDRCRRGHASDRSHRSGSSAPQDAQLGTLVSSPQAGHFLQPFAIIHPAIER